MSQAFRDEVVDAGSLRWRVRIWGDPSSQPTALLLHGTGSSVHSWLALAPLLAPSFALVAPDLPGHGDTAAPPQSLLTLPGMAAGVTALLADLAVVPRLAIGHSAGAAVAIRMALSNTLPDARGLVSLNGALVPFNRPTARIFSPLAKAMFTHPLASRFFAWQAGNTRSVERLIRNTGSTVDRDGVEAYRRLVADPKHVAAAIGMMANWDLDALDRDIGQLALPLLLIAGQSDRAVPADQVFPIRDRVRDGRVVLLRGLGHLAHEERADDVAGPILDFARSCGVLPA